MRLDSLHQVHFFCCRLVVSCRPDLLADTAFQHFQIGEDQLQIDGLYITERIDASIYVNDIAVLKASYHMDDGVHFPNIGKELVAKPLSFGCTFYKSRNIYEFNDSRNDLFCLVHVRQHIQSLVRYSYDAHIRVNGTERVVG